MNALSECSWTCALCTDLVLRKMKEGGRLKRRQYSKFSLWHNVMNVTCVVDLKVTRLTTAEKKRKQKWRIKWKMKKARRWKQCAHTHHSFVGQEEPTYFGAPEASPGRRSPRSRHLEFTHRSRHFLGGFIHCVRSCFLSVSIGINKFVKCHVVVVVVVVVTITADPKCIFILK